MKLETLAAPALAALLLAGCVTGLPWAHKKDANAAAVVAQAAPLIAECRQHFAADLHDKAVEVDSGPTLVNDGTITTVRLDAQMQQQPNAGYLESYSCEFDNGKLGAHGLVED